jgi:GNAT superfamily N-acetyltransferase
MAGIGHKLGTLRAHVEWHGAFAGLRLLAGEPLDRLGVLRVAVCYALPDAALALSRLAVNSDPELVIRPLSVEEVRDRSVRREDWFFRDAVERSIARGELCIGGYLNGVLATSVWFGSKPVPVMGSSIGFARDCVWQHRGFTRPEFRGRGLHALVIKQGFAFYAGQGYTTILNTIIWTNDSSRRLHRRLGYRHAGTLIRIGADRSGKTFLCGGREFGLQLLR